MAELSVGNRTIPLNTATKWVAEYTDPDTADPKKPFGYPWYDTYDTGWSDLLVDGDLLAPGLLNVQVSIAAYASLKRAAREINEVLSNIALGTSLLMTADLTPLGQLFAVLDEDKPFDVGGTTLAKVLHRKRPDFIPLYDREVGKCFLEESANGAPPTIHQNRNRTWSDFIQIYAAAIKSNILAARDDWETVQAANAGSHPIGLLRTFDIVAWNSGKGRS